MRSVIPATILITITLLFSEAALCQTDEIRDATGLPIPIGQPVIYGRVTFRGLPADQRKPLVHVTLFIDGSMIQRFLANDKGYFYFLRSNSNGATLVYEVNNMEVSREIIPPGLERTVRREIEVDWPTFKDRFKTRPATVSAQMEYQRTTDNEEIFEKASAALRAKKPDQAVIILKELVKRDPKDFIAWAELGTAHSAQSQIADAERAYNMALELKPNLMIGLMNLGRLQLSAKRYNEAVVTFTRAINADPSSADAFHYLGEAYLQVKLGSKAAIALNEAIRLAPIEKADLHLRLATLYIAAGARDLAVKEYSLLLQKVPDHPQKDKISKFISENTKE